MKSQLDVSYSACINRRVNLIHTIFICDHKAVTSILIQIFKGRDVMQSSCLRSKRQVHAWDVESGEVK